VLGPGRLNFTYWDKVVKALVTPNTTLDGVVVNAFNYTKLVNNSDYQKFTCQVENVIGIANFTYTEWRAFWINAYNYLAVRVIFENQCAIDLFGSCRTLRSIKEAFEQQPSVFDIVWTTPVLLINGWNDNQSISLDDIEVSYLRAPTQFKEDVRIHGCIVCASVSCPDLRMRAYTVENLEEEMDDNVNKWVGNPAKGSAVSGNTITLSPIFKWFADDFNNVTGRSNYANLSDFLLTHGPENVQKVVESGNAMYSYFTYNWNLNGVINKCSVDRPCFPWWALLTLILGSLVVVIISVICVRRRSYARGYVQIQ